jgi:5-carboxymethyl-2-hydroxymuconate isomerase
MPHLVLDYSANLEPAVDVNVLIRIVHEAALETGLFPPGGIRTRAARHDAYRIADGHPDNAYVHLTARIGQGRTEEARRTAGEHIFAALKAALAETFAQRPLAISFELAEIDALSFKHNNLHAILEERAKP